MLKNTCFYILLLNFIIAIPNVSYARSSICTVLERQLTSPTVSTNNAQKAVERQKDQLRITQNYARSNGCKGSFFGFKRPAATQKCIKINTVIQRMERNIVRLQNKSLTSKKSDILAALEVNSCYKTSKQLKTVKSTSIFTALFGVESQKKQKPYQVASLEKATEKSSVTMVNARSTLDIAPKLPKGSFTTLCVRTCDGYYFPVSFSTPSTLFSRDAKICNSMCPATEAKLYYHKVVSEEAEDMVGLDAAPYTKLPTAFEYRKSDIDKKQGCSCKLGQDQTKSMSRIVHTQGLYEKAKVETTLYNLLEESIQSMAELWQKIFLSGGEQNKQQKIFKVVGAEFLPAQSIVTR